MEHAMWFDHIFVAVLGLIGLYAATIGRKTLHAIEFDTAQKINFYRSNGIALWIGGIVTCVIWVLGDRPLAALGLTLDHVSLPLGLAVTVGFIASFTLDMWSQVATPKRRAELHARWRRDAAFLPENTRELRHFCFIALAAGVCEEIIARGFLILYLMSFTGSGTAGTIIAVGAPALGFAVMHLYQGWRAVGSVTILASAFGAIFLITGSLLIPILLHIAVDIFGGVLALRLAQASARGTGAPPSRNASAAASQMCRGSDIDR